ncbi:hypothetical protein [Falsarthrobacter nasiphocae]|uniref:Uncharacterized protein n=1 Tax=Falsarthrobacter nasiphocae TaxID=189863 RepID=A0AAE3YG65_9MICC|nr:hypothetical protein [Falsarthrobacter nasiphocae]MDR6891642.1 hypothetical protein [Falsarthrobacter nasiphocae]
MRIGYPIAVVLSVLCLVVALTDGLGGALPNPNGVAGGCLLAGLVALFWQQARDRDKRHHNLK